MKKKKLKKNKSIFIDPFENETKALISQCPKNY